ncbi:unnamed protein product [Meloidogyne enterolobii]|uniref:Tetraspanin n=5 Tax=Meloidogyne TaxID=189290 RepID=A0A6V7VZ10_MELEN|nr:unnamed protein product [Meloidogyne enterolobii]CAD2187717.1 unnamed protein product [Meloidogyne enterolobii]
MVEGGITLVKYLLFFANFILWVVGICFLISGILLQMKYSGLLDVLGDERLTTPVILLAIGCLFTLLGFIGYCGAIRENYCLTVSFAVLLALLLMTETAIAILVYALHEPLNEVIVTQLAQGIERYPKSKGVSLAWDQVQRQFYCCGVNNASDWRGTPPDSCCTRFHNGCAKIVQPPLYEIGCVEAVQRWIVANAMILGCISAFLAALQVIGICFACCLSKSILKEFNDFYY